MRTYLSPSSSIETLESRIAPAGLSAKAGALSIVPAGGLTISPTFAGPSTASPEPVVMSIEVDSTGASDNASLVQAAAGALHVDDIVLIDTGSALNWNAVNYVNPHGPLDPAQWFAPAFVQEVALVVKPILPEPVALVPEILLPRFYF